jgi:hypothetical protein
MTADVLLAEARGAIIRVGDGRGFLVERAPWPHRVITAAHCLPYLPPAHPASYTHERTYANLLGPLNGALAVWAECLFVDPIADLAVLDSPDGQVLYDESEAYETFMENRPTLRIGALMEACPAWLLTLGGEWERCLVEPGIRGRSLTVIDAIHGHAPGTSGSPILTEDGHAVGLISVGSETGGKVQVRQPGQPVLTNDLPAWLLAECRDAVKGGA